MLSPSPSPETLGNEFTFSSSPRLFGGGAKKSTRGACAPRSSCREYFVMNCKRVVILGATGSIGESALKVARDIPERMEIVGLAARSNAQKLAAAANEVRPEALCLVDETQIGGNFDIEYNGGFIMSIPVFDPNDIKYKFEPMFSGYEER